MKTNDAVFPAGTYDYNVYIGGIHPVGAADSIKLPTIGPDGYEQELRFTSLNSNAADLLRIGKATTVEVRAAEKEVNKETSEMEYRGFRIVERIEVKAIELGTLEHGKGANIGVKAKVTNCVVTYDGNELLYIDEINGHNRVNGIEQNPLKAKLL